MPHYRDGTEAQLGDVARGKPYNTEHEVTGVVVGITPSSDTCNLRIAFARAAKPGEAMHGVSAFDDGAGTPLTLVSLARDYGETGDFELVHRS